MNTIEAEQSVIEKGRRMRPSCPFSAAVVQAAPIAYDLDATLDKAGRLADFRRRQGGPVGGVP